MSTKQIIQHVTSALTFLAGLIFCLLKIIGITILINEADINTLLFSLGSLIAIAIEIIPFIIKTIKDKKITQVLIIVNKVVQTIEELEGLTSYEKKAKAMEVISKECKEQGLEIETEDISNMIEVSVALRNKVVK